MKHCPAAEVQSSHVKSKQRQQRLLRLQLGGTSVQMSSESPTAYTRLGCTTRMFCGQAEARRDRQVRQLSAVLRCTCMPAGQLPLHLPSPLHLLLQSTQLQRPLQLPSLSTPSSQPPARRTCRLAREMARLLADLAGRSFSFSLRFCSSSLKIDRQHEQAAAVRAQQAGAASYCRMQQQRLWRPKHGTIAIDTLAPTQPEHSPLRNSPPATHCSASMCCILIFSSSYSDRQFGHLAARLVLAASSRIWL